MSQSSLELEWLKAAQSALERDRHQSAAFSDSTTSVPAPIHEGSAKGDSPLCRLPAQVLAAVQAVAMVSNEGLSRPDLSRVIQSDPWLAAKVIATARRFHPQAAWQPIDVERAVSLLGANRVQVLVAAAVFPPLQQECDLVPSGFVKHSLLIASSSAAAASTVDVPAREAFMVGLLHDVGVVVLHNHDRRAFEQTRTGKSNESLEREREWFGVDHAVSGELAVEQAGLSTHIVRTIGEHHLPLSHQSRLGRAVTLGESLAAALVAHSCHEPIPSLESAMNDARVLVDPGTLHKRAQRRWSDLRTLIEGLRGIQ